LARTVTLPTAGYRDQQAIAPVTTTIRILQPRSATIKQILVHITGIETGFSSISDR